MTTHYAIIIQSDNVGAITAVHERVHLGGYPNLMPVVQKYYKVSEKTRHILNTPVDEFKEENHLTYLFTEMEHTLGDMLFAVQSLDKEMSDELTVSLAVNMNGVMHLYEYDDINWHSYIATHAFPFKYSDTSNVMQMRLYRVFNYANIVAPLTNTMRLRNLLEEIRTGVSQSVPKEEQIVYQNILRGLNNATNTNSINHLNLTSLNLQEVQQLTAGFMMQLTRIPDTLVTFQRILREAGAYSGLKAFSLVNFTTFQLTALNARPLIADKMELDLKRYLYSRDVQSLPDDHYLNIFAMNFFKWYKDKPLETLEAFAIARILYANRFGADFDDPVINDADYIMVENFAFDDVADRWNQIVTKLNKITGVSQ